MRRGLNLSVFIFLGGVAGVLSGLFLPSDFNAAFGDLAKAFIFAVKCLITPLMFSTLVVGIAGHGDDFMRLGRLAVKSFIYFEAATTIALAVGLTMVNILKPGVGVSLEGVSRETNSVKEQRLSWNSEFGENIGHVVTDSFFHSAAQNSVLHVVMCAVLFGVATLMTPAHHRRPMLEFLDSLSQIMFKVTNLVMLFAPVAVAASLAFTISKVGIAILASLAKLVATLFLSLFIFVIIVFVPVLLLCRIPFMNALRTLRRPAFIGFCTTSSEAALPQAMVNLERFGIPSHIVRFVLPTGYSFNLDGTTLHLAVASVFAAQASGMDMPLGIQLKMMLMLMLTSKGVAAVPRASYMLLLSMVDPFGMDVAAINIILGVDAFMDMARTVVNLCGNCIAAMAVAVWEGEMDMEVAKGIKAPQTDHMFDDPESLDGERKKEAPHYV